MIEDDEYRRQAADAQQQADGARNDDDRAAWLRIAQGWMSLLRKRPQSEEDAFANRVKAEGTGTVGLGFFELTGMEP